MILKALYAAWDAIAYTYFTVTWLIICGLAGIAVWEFGTVAYLLWLVVVWFITPLVVRRTR
jgi:hypothetical protein